MNLYTFIAVIISALTTGALVLFIPRWLINEKGLPKYTNTPLPPKKKDLVIVTFNEYKRMNELEKTKFLEMVSRDLRNLSIEYRNKWAVFSLYLDQEVSEGKTEFRVKVGEDHKCYIHPLGKDGKTLDFEI